MDAIELVVESVVFLVDVVAALVVVLTVDLVVVFIVDFVVVLIVVFLDFFIPKKQSVCSKVNKYHNIYV